MSSIKLVDANSSEYTLNPVLLGYKSIIDLAIKYTQLESGAYRVYDYGTSYDKRFCQCSWQLTRADSDSLLSALEVGSAAKSINMVLPSGSGFFPFGPDKGDTSTDLNPFQVRMTVSSHKGIGSVPYKYYETEVEFVAESYPSYSPPSQDHPATDEGRIDIGGITGLRFPDDFADIDREIGIQTNTSFGGTPYSNASGLLYDSSIDTATLNMKLNLENSAALINYIVNTGRGGTIVLDNLDECYIFGAVQTYSQFPCTMINNVIEVNNPMYNRFEFDLSFYRVP